MTFKTLTPFLVLLSICLSIVSSTQAASTSWKSNEHGRVRLISSYDVAPASGTLPMGLHFQPAPGWYLYWKNPGDSGLAPNVQWSGTGFIHPEILWPKPDRLILPGDITEYGYEREVVYPVQAQLTGGALRVHAKLSYLTCDTACLPYQYTFTLDIPRGAAKADVESTALIESALTQVPPAGMSDADILNSLHTYHKTPGVPSAPALPVSPSPRLAWILVSAFIGGILLNIMPCVLPVLSIKLLGLLKHGGGHRAMVIRYTLASAAGIVVSFLALGAAAVLIKNAGGAVGWGTQFQNPFFVVLLAIVCALFAMNLWGWFEIGMPRIFGRFATSYGQGETIKSHFVSGLLATLLATPCSAPFLGTAMGFALTQSAPVVLAAFGVAGAGMALPYFILASFPESLVWLPRPGAWMIRLKTLFGFFLAGTALWLGWVFYQQVMISHPASPLPGERATPSGEGALAWTIFDESSIPSQLAAGKSVLVDVTADWCVTCHYNEKFVLGDAKVVAELQRQGIVLMRADWTRQDPVIGSYLKKYGRAGIPFYALYRPGKEPVLLSEFLTVSRVLSALRS